MKRIKLTKLQADELRYKCEVALESLDIMDEEESETTGPIATAVLAQLDKGTTLDVDDATAEWCAEEMENSASIADDSREYDGDVWAMNAARTYRAAVELFRN
jgi:hypothetical protein